MKTFYQKRYIVGFILNLSLVVFGFIGIVLSIQKHGLSVFLFYTENSNYFSFAVSVFYCACFAFCAKENKIPKIIVVLRYVSVVCTTITLIVVVFVLTPLAPQMLNYLFFEGSCFYQHLICPIVSFVSFCFFENNFAIAKKQIFIAIIPTIVYGAILLVLNIFKLVVGPYPFFFVYDLPWYLPLLFCIAIFIGCIAIAYAVYISGKKYKTKNY